MGGISVTPCIINGVLKKCFDNTMRPITYGGLKICKFIENISKVVIFINFCMRVCLIACKMFYQTNCLTFMRILLKKTKQNSVKLIHFKTESTLVTCMDRSGTISDL